MGPLSDLWLLMGATKGICSLHHQMWSVTQLDSGTCLHHPPVKASTSLTPQTHCVLHSHHKHTVCPSLTPQTHCVSFTHHKCTVLPLLKPCNTLCFLYVVSVSTETCHTSHCCCRYKYRKRAYMCFLSISCCVS